MPGSHTPVVTGSANRYTPLVGIPLGIRCISDELSELTWPRDLFIASTRQPAPVVLLGRRKYAITAPSRGMVRYASSVAARADDSNGAAEGLDRSIESISPESRPLRSQFACRKTRVEPESPGVGCLQRHRKDSGVFECVAGVVANPRPALCLRWRATAENRASSVRDEQTTRRRLRRQEVCVRGPSTNVSASPACGLDLHGEPGPRRPEPPSRCVAMGRSFRPVSGYEPRAKGYPRKSGVAP